MSLATLLVLADGRLPAGGHAHSGGLEAAVAAGRVSDLRSLEGFLRGRLATSGVVSAFFAAAACFRLTVDNREELSYAGGLLAPPSEGRGRLAGAAEAFKNLDEAFDARTPSPALRRASRAQGRALMRAGRAIWPKPTIDHVARPDREIDHTMRPDPEIDHVTWPLPDIGREPHHPIALGAVAKAAGLTKRDAAVAAAYGSLTGPATAAVRLLGLDPYGTHALLATLAPDCDRIADDASVHAHDHPDDLPAASAPLLDLGAEHHSTWEVRLFAS